MAASEAYSASLPLPGDHPVQIALRTYSLALALSLGPAILPFITSSKARTQASRKIPSILRRELGPNGFAFSISLAIAGGSYLRKLLTTWEQDYQRHSGNQVSDILQIQGEGERERHRTSLVWEVVSSLKKILFSLSGVQKTFVLNALTSVVASILLQRRGTLSRRGAAAIAHTDIPITIPIDEMPRKRGISRTLDLTLLLFVRALDSVVYGAIHDRVVSKCGSTDGGFQDVAESSKIGRTGESSVEKTKRMKQWWVSHLDAAVFSACSARVMWCFFYKPERLPPSYVKWITKIAEIDPRLCSVLRALRDGSFSYVGGCAASDELSALSKDLGYQSSWGNPALIPAYGTRATEVWKKLGVQGRNGIGGVPCEIVHGNGAGNSCVKNVFIRGSKAWLAAVAIHLPVYILPIVLTRPTHLLRFDKLISPLLSVLRSATFLSSFVSLIWFGVCSTRTMILARLFPFISHDYFDGPYGCIYIASLICGSSIWIEHERRRGEVALYALPRAIRSCLSDNWLRSGRKGVDIGERFVFVMSLATLLTAAVHRPDALRGLSRWTLEFIMNGPALKFWRRKRPPPHDTDSEGTDSRF